MTRSKHLLISLVLLMPFASCALAKPSSFPHINMLHARQTTTPAPKKADEATAWYPSWLGKTFPPDQVSWDKYTSMAFAFALTTPDSSVIALDSDSEALLPTFVSEAKKNSVNALLAIGGWTGSQYFSSAVATAENRTLFVKAVLDVTNKYQLDGIDFDWEYPGKQGIGCNINSPQDGANFLSFLQQLKNDPQGSQLILTAAVGLSPFAGEDGQPMSDVSKFADVLDFIAIMAYDVWGSWTTTVGPNAPLQDSCAPASAQAGSGAAAVSAWTTAGFPVDQASIVLGVAAYGRAYSVIPSEASTKLANYPAFDQSKIPPGEDETAGMTGVDQCGAATGVTGIFNFEGLINAGYLECDGAAAAGMTYKFDQCSQTPFLYNPTSQVMVSYDDVTSFATKGAYIKNTGLKGFAMWHAIGDSDDILLDSISNSMEIEFEYCS